MDDRESLLLSPVVDGELLPVFVYGTLQPDEVRWFALEGRVRNPQGEADAVTGRLWDTGLQYPALTLDGDATVPGRVMWLREDSATSTWQHLVEIEGAVEGYYVPRVVVTHAGRTALVFAFDALPEPHFTPIRAWQHGPIVD